MFSPNCWLWDMPRKTGERRQPYATFTIAKGKTTSIHRYAYELAYGPIPTGLVIDHLCSQPMCVRPDHLEAVTQRTNILRGGNIAAQNMIKTHCHRGHPFDAENTYLVPKGRSCKACQKVRSQTFAEKRKA